MNDLTKLLALQLFWGTWHCQKKNETNKRGYKVHFLVFATSTVLMT